MSRSEDSVNLISVQNNARYRVSLSHWQMLTPFLIPLYKLLWKGVIWIQCGWIWLNVLHWVMIPSTTLISSVFTLELPQSKTLHLEHVLAASWWLGQKWQELSDDPSRN